MEAAVAAELHRLTGHSEVQGELLLHLLLLLRV